MKNIQLIGLTFMLLSCNASEKQVPKSVNYGLSVNYDLKGEVKFLSEKMFPAVYDENKNFIPDTAATFLFCIINRSFDKEGNIKSTSYFNKDSTFIGMSEYYESETIQFRKDGKKQDISKIISVEDGILYVESYNPSTKELQQKAWTKYENEKILWQKSIRFRDKDSLYLEYVYCRNSDDLDTLIKTKNEISEDYYLTNIKYLSFDEKGNWTERIECSLDLDDTNNYRYIVKQRRIEYY